MENDKERPKHFKRARINPKQRMAKSKRKVAGYNRQMERMREKIAEQLALQGKLIVDYPAFFDTI